jgi:hypothetical protein
LGERAEGESNRVASQDRQQWLEALLKRILV